MIYSVAADIIVVLHLSFVVFVVFGGLLVLRWRQIAWVHVPAAAWGAVAEFRALVCPLTPLEQALRRAGGEDGYTEGFVEHYLVPILYPPGLTPAIQLALGMFVVVVNAVIYGYLIVRWRRAKKEIR